MAETVTLVELDIDQSQLLKDITKLQGEITDLKDDTKTLTKANKDLEAEGKKNTKQYKDNSTQIEKNKIQTKGLSTEYSSNQKTLVALNVSETKQLGTLQKLEIQNKELRTEAKSLDLTRASGQKRLTQINKQLDTNNEFIEKNADATKKQKLNIGNYGSALQGVGGPLARATTGIQAMTKAALAFIATPIGLVIAAIGVALAALTSFFKQTEEGQNALSKVVRVFSSILDNLLDLLGDVGEAIFNAFTKPKEAIESFVAFIGRVGKFFQDTFGNIVGGAIDLFVAKFQKNLATAGLLWQRFKGLFVDNAEGIEEAQNKISGANESIIESQDRMRKGAEALGAAFDKAKEKVKGFFEEVQDDARIARLLADEEAAIRKLERENLVENAKLAKQSAQLRAEAEQLKLVNAEKSLELFSKSFDLDEKILANELEIAERKSKAAVISGNLAKSNIETLEEIARLEADVENKRKEFDEIRRGRTRRLNSIRKEAFAQEKERLATQLELEVIHTDAVIRENQRIIDDDEATNAAILEASKQNTALKLEILAAESDLELAELNSRLELKLISEADFLQQLALLKAKFADQAAQELEENAEFEVDLSKSVSDSKVDLAKDVTASLDALFEENTIASKFAAIAQSLINTFLGAQAAFAQTPGGIGIKVGAALAATAIGLANVRKIRQVQTGGGASGGGGASTSGLTGLSNLFSPGGISAPSDGGLTTQSLIDPNTIQEGLERALANSPQKILIIDEVTAKQMSKRSVSQVATV